MDNELLYIIIFLLVINVWKDTSKTYYLDKGKKIGFTLNAIIMLICTALILIVLFIKNSN